MKTKDGEIIKCDECGAEAVIGYELTDDYGQAQQFAYCATHDDLDDLDYRDKIRLASTWSDEADFDETDIAACGEER